VRRVLAVLVALVLAAAAVFGLLALYDRAAPKPVRWLEAAGLEARFATVDGHRLRYVRSGQGPAVVLVHGFGSSLYTWKDVIPDLAADHDVLALDLPGFGLSDQPPDLGVEDLPRAVLGLMDQLRIARAALVGNSMGGAAVALLAARHPDRTSALVLIDAAGFNMDPRAQPTFVRVAMSPLGSLLARLPGKRLLVELALRQVLHDPRLVTDERVAEYLVAARRRGGFASVQSLGASLRDRYGLVQQALASVRAPTLIVWGREDAWIPLRDAAAFAAAISGARQEVIEGSGHLPQEEKPDALRRILRRFLASAEAGDTRQAPGKDQAANAETDIR
jgi:pimeloyl-ACP methyl ester carboxylesterase